MKITALIIGIDGWEKYTRPLIESIRNHEPECRVVVVDNASKEPYPTWQFPTTEFVRTERLSYAKAINLAAQYADDADWLVILSNDVICTGPFAHLLTSQLHVMGPEECQVFDIPYLMGWCVIASSLVFGAVGGWDENYIVSSWEDVDFSVASRSKGFCTTVSRVLPFVHLDQRQRFGLPEFQGTHETNKQYFLQKWFV